MKNIEIKIFKGFKKGIFGFGILSLVGWSIVAGSHYIPQTVYAEKIVEVPSRELPPVLKKIMACEGKSQHAKNGQITYNVNNNGSIDLGIMQINSVHFALATKLGYDLTKEEDNIKFGQYLYFNFGTEPWYSSKSCWNK